MSFDFGGLPLPIRHHRRTMVMLLEWVAADLDGIDVVESPRVLELLNRKMML